MGNIFLTGESSSSDFPTTNDAFDKIYNSTESFLIKLAGNGSQLIYSSYFGGDSNDYGQGIAIDQMNNIYITGDTWSDNVPTSPGAFDKTENGQTDIFVTKFSFNPFIKINSFSLLKDEVPTSQVYSCLCPYSFMIDLTDTASISDLDNVFLTLDPQGSNIQLKWDRATGSFSEVSDPNDYLSIDSSSTANNFVYQWFINFNLTFNWNYPNEELHNVEIHATSATFSPAWFNVTNIYHVENDLVFNGSLLVKGEDDRIILENDIVRGGEKLTWTGLNTVYEGTTDIYPPNAVFNISINDEKDDSWIDSPESSSLFEVVTTSPKETNTDGFKYTISIIEIPEECDASDQKFTLKIDGDNVSFSDPSPNNITWQTDSEVLVGINISDVGGGVVNGESIKFSISKNNGSTWNEWKDVPDLNSENIIAVKNTIVFDEGRDNLIKWQAMDSLGNGPAKSNEFRILVDTEKPRFSNPWPSSSDISEKENVELGITITDGISGVDASTIKYSISLDKGKTWGEWTAVEDLVDGFVVEVHTNITFPNGTDNLIKWQVIDIAGNGPSKSQPFIIKVNNWTQTYKLKTTLLSPPNGVILNQTNILLSWKLEDSEVQDITYDIYFENKTPPDLDRVGLRNNSYIMDNLVYGETYYWSVMPTSGNIKGSCSSGIWWFKIELPEDKQDRIFDLSIVGPKSITLYQGQNKSVSLTVTNLGDSDDFIKLEIQAGLLSEFITLDDNSFISLGSKNYIFRNLEITLSKDVEPGFYEVKVTAISLESKEKEKDNHILSIEVKEIKNDKTNNGNNNGSKNNITDNNVTKEEENPIIFEYIVFLIIIIIVIILLVIIAVIKKRKRTVSQELITASSVTIKPGTQPTVTISQGQIATTATTPQLTSVSQNISSQQIIPNLASTTQASQVPQLPPAQITSTDTDVKTETTSETLTQPTVVTPTLASAPTPTVSNLYNNQIINKQNQSNPQVSPIQGLTQKPTPTLVPNVHLPESDNTTETTKTPTIVQPNKSSNQTSSNHFPGITQNKKSDI
jgi:hypothetical protein